MIDLTSLLPGESKIVTKTPSSPILDLEDFASSLNERPYAETITIQSKRLKVQDKPFLTPEQVWRLRDLPYRLSRKAIEEARVVLKGAQDDLRTHTPSKDRRRPYVRPSFKKRVCSGSNRHRVLVN